MKYVLRGAIDRGTDLSSPCKEAYVMLKAAITGSPSLVFTRRHETGVTEIRSHQEENHKVCQKIVGYDAIALYLSTMLQDMPCGGGRVRHNRIPTTIHRFLSQLKSGECFGFAEVDIEIPKPLWPKFEEMCSFFVNKEIPEEAVPTDIRKYLTRTGRPRLQGKRLLCSLS